VYENLVAATLTQLLTLPGSSDLADEKKVHGRTVLGPTSRALGQIEGATMLPGSTMLYSE